MCAEDDTIVIYSRPSNGYPGIILSFDFVSPIQTSSEIHPSVRFSDITYGATKHKLLSSKYYREKWAKMRTTIYPASPIDEDARGAINVEFSTQLREYHAPSSPNLTSFSR
jgi:hypothetical protein